jgi:hypothetical protein
MIDIEQMWEDLIKEATRRAELAGHGDLADYLALRGSNDLARNAAIDWLFEVFSERVSLSNLMINRQSLDTHSFKVGNSLMVGRLLTFTLGVRTLKVEAGWPRNPSHGIVTGGGIGRARLSLPGIPHSTSDLILIKEKDSPPHWIIESTRRAQLSEEYIDRLILLLQA